MEGATLSAPPAKEFPNVVVLRQTPQLLALLSVIRNKDTPRGDFIFFSDRIIRDGSPYGVFAALVGASAYLCFLPPACRSLSELNLFIQLYYSKLPPDIKDRYCFLLDPMLATGGSAIKAIEVLKENGVPEERILFVNLICCPEGISNVIGAHPRIKIVTAFIDNGLDHRKYIVPGLGDFGCRYFGTEALPGDPTGPAAAGAATAAAATPSLSPPLPAPATATATANVSHDTASSSFPEVGANSTLMEDDAPSRPSSTTPPAAIPPLRPTTSSPEAVAEFERAKQEQEARKRRDAEEELRRKEREAFDRAVAAKAKLEAEAEAKKLAEAERLKAEEAERRLKLQEQEQRMRDFERQKEQAAAEQARLRAEEERRREAEAFARLEEAKKRTAEEE
ncbi:Uracil phosphoribosyltransferase, synthesizes UMP from uracil, partial [Cladochytrium tenue]